MLELRRLEVVGDFGPSTLECPWDPVKEVRCRRTSTSLLLLWNALLLHRLLFESVFEASCFLKVPSSVSIKRNWTFIFAAGGKKGELFPTGQVIFDVFSLVKNRESLLGQIPGRDKFVSLSVDVRIV